MAIKMKLTNIKYQYEEIPTKLKLQIALLKSLGIGIVWWEKTSDEITAIPYSEISKLAENYLKK